MHAFWYAVISHRVEIDETFRNNLKTVRESRGLNPDELARKAGLNRRGVRDIEEGRSQSPKLSTVFKLAEALSIDPGVLLGLGPRPTIRRELVDFLGQYDEAGQARLLGALEAFRGLSGE